MWKNKEIKYIVSRYKEVRDDPYEYRSAVIDSLSRELHCTRQAIIAKLTSLNVYKKKGEVEGDIPPKTKTKQDFINEIENKLRLSELNTLIKASRADLKRIADKL